MDRNSRTIGIATWLLAVLAALGLLTACAGSGYARAAARRSRRCGGAPAPQEAPAPPPIKRDIVKTASMAITVGNPAEAADKATATVDNAQGRVDSRSTDAGSGAGRARTSMVLRVPAAKLDDVMRDLAALGTVEHAEVNTDDVTAQRVDLDARIKALQTSVDRLLAIMRDARDPDALIKAEDALSERQAELDSLRASAMLSATKSPTAPSTSPSSPRPSAARRPTSTAASSVRSKGAGTLWFPSPATWFYSSACCCRGWARWPWRVASSTESSGW